MMRKYLVHAAFIALVLGGGTLIGASNVPDGWYEALRKPVFNPPNWLFGPAWTFLYILIGIAGARTWLREAYGTEMKIWWMQLVLNFLWSPVFFTLHQIAIALGIVLGMLAAILTFIVATWKRDRTAALLFVPYACWVAFASLLNAAILVLN